MADTEKGENMTDDTKKQDQGQDTDQTRNQ